MGHDNREGHQRRRKDSGSDTPIERKLAWRTARLTVGTVHSAQTKPVNMGEFTETGMSS